MKRPFSFLLISFLIFLTQPNLAQVRLKETISFDSSADELFQVLKKNQAKNIIEAVDLLAPEFFKAGNFRLFFHSQSIQPSSEKYPRIVLSGKDSKLFLGFNHHLGVQRDLEVIQFKEKESRWEFREISFKKGNPEISPPNPKTCLQCHGEPNAKPNILRFEAARLEFSMPFPSVIRLRPFDEEKFWRDFISNAKDDSIYSKLALPTTKMF